MEKCMKEQLNELLPEETLLIWNEFTDAIDSLYEIKESISKSLQDIYEKTKVLHDGKWLWIPLDDKVMIMDKITMLKIKRKPNRKEKI